MRQSVLPRSDRHFLEILILELILPRVVSPYIRILAFRHVINLAYTVSSFDFAATKISKSAFSYLHQIQPQVQGLCDRRACSYPFTF